MGGKSMNRLAPLKKPDAKKASGFWRLMLYRF